MNLLAHSKPGSTESEWQTLPDHLRQAAELARKFAEDFKAAEWG